MSAWGPTSFENDAAQDWLSSLSKADDAFVLEEAFSRVLDSRDYVEAYDCSVAIAAAEVVAALRQPAVPDMPVEVHEFVARMNAAPPEALVNSALRALKRIKTNSDLQQLWDESDARKAWYDALDRVESRLK